MSPFGRFWVKVTFAQTGSLTEEFVHDVIREGRHSPDKVAPAARLIG